MTAIPLGPLGPFNLVALAQQVFAIPLAQRLAPSAITLAALRALPGVEAFASETAAINSINQRFGTTATPASGAYAKRHITLTFQLGTGSFGGTGSNKITLAGLRVRAQIAQANMPSAGHAILRIYGMTLDHINALTKAGTNWAASNNGIMIMAGDDVTGLSTIYNGTVYEAYPDFNGMPETAFVVIANAGEIIQLKPAPAVTFPGQVSVADALKQIIKPVGLTLENNGVTAVLASPYYQGSTRQQIWMALNAADATGFLDTNRKVLAIWPKTGGRQGKSILIAPETGMIGYPEFMRYRVRLRTLFNPGIIGVGVPIEVKSQLKTASGKMFVSSIEYELESETPGGLWEMKLDAAPQQTPGGDSSKQITTNQIIAQGGT